MHKTLAQISAKFGLLIATIFGSAYTLAAPTVYVPLGSANQVIAIDAATNKITATFDGVLNPHGLVATPDGEYLIAGSLKEDPANLPPGDKTPNSFLYLIHPEHGHVMSKIPVAGWTHHLAISPNGRYVLSTHAMRSYITVLDMQSNKIIKTIKTGLVPNYTLITKDGKHAYVSNTGSNSITEIDLGTWRVVRTLDGGAAPAHLAFSGDQSTIFVSNPRSGEVIGVDVKSGKIISRYKIGTDIHGLDMGDDGKTLFVSSKADGILVSINTKTGEKKTLALTPAPYHLNAIRGTGKVYISSRHKPVIWVVDQNSLKLITTIQLPGGEGHQMAIVN
jgi:YVTN family beta-propeller protein